MNILLKIELTVVVLLLLSTVFIRVGILDADDEPLLQDPVETTQATQEPSQDTTPKPLPSTEPEETEPPLKLTFGEDFTLGSRDYFVYDCGDANLMAISGDPDKQVYPASVTKLFTAYVALQYLQPDDVITLGQEVYLVAADSSLAYLKKGQTISVSDLLMGMLLPSGNDAAYGLAAAAARAKSGQDLDPEDALDYFVAMMNETAMHEGMSGSHFANPDGYHHPDHYLTCTDLITLAQLALGNDLIRACVTTLTDKVTFSNGEVAKWSNTNHLIDPESQYYHADALGLKTGHTGAAGFCLLSAFQLDGEYIIVGTFGCERPEDRYIDTLKLYDLVVATKHA